MYFPYVSPLLFYIVQVLNASTCVNKQHNGKNPTMLYDINILCNNFISDTFVGTMLMLDYVLIVICDLVWSLFLC